MTTTVVSFRDVTKSFRTEWEAYIWMVDRFLKDKGNFFVTQKADVKHVLKGGNGAVLFAPVSQGMNDPKGLSNGWYAETCLNEGQKIASLFLIAQSIGISSERDYHWEAQGRPTPVQRDTDTMLKELENLP
jgi:hypothetical protein